MARITWDDGRLIKLTEGDTATAGGLNNGQLYGFFFYNEAEHDATTKVEVNWRNDQKPQEVTVHGTTAQEGPASVLMVYGDDTNTVSASIVKGNPGANLNAFVCSVGMPKDTSGINDIELPDNGQTQQFKRLTRYYKVLATHWYDLTIESDVNQFIVAQFQEMRARLFVVKSTADPKANVYGVGTAEKEKMYKVEPTGNERMIVDVQGDGSQTVWISAASLQDSQQATITLQSLAQRNARPGQSADPAIHV